MIPNEDECLRLLRVAGCGDEVVSHCVAVKNLAVIISEKCGANTELVKAGALLHDIGRSKTHSPRHAIEGAAIARWLGLPEEIEKIIERHIGGGIPKEEARALGLPAKDYVPETLEEKIVAHADNLIASDRKEKLTELTERYLKKGLRPAADRIIELHSELSRLCGVDLDNIQL